MGFSIGKAFKKVTKVVKKITNPITHLKPSTILNPVGAIAKELGVRIPVVSKIEDKTYNKIDRIWTKTDPISSRIEKSFEKVFNTFDITSKLLAYTNSIHTNTNATPYSETVPATDDTYHIINYKGNEYKITNGQIKELLKDTSIDAELRKLLETVLTTGKITTDVTSEVNSITGIEFKGAKVLNISSHNLSDFISTAPVGIRNAFDNTQFLKEFPDLTSFVGTPSVKPFNEKGEFIGSLPVVYPYVRYTELDPDFNSCSDWKICIPDFSIDLDKFKWIDNLTDKNSATWKTIEEINKLAEEVDKVPEARITVEFISQIYKDLPENIKQLLNEDLRQLGEARANLPTPDKEPDYNDLSAYLSAPFPKLKLQEAEDSEELKKLLEKIKELGLEDLNVPILEVDNRELTDRTVDGLGIFDHIATSIFNQLKMAVDKQLITKNEVANIYSNFLVQGIQTASQFALEKNNIVLQSWATKVQAAQASVAILEAKTRLLMLPSQLRLAYAQIEAQLEQINLLKVQTQLEKEKFPQIVAQTDLILAQTDGQRLQNEQAQVGIQLNKLQIEQSKEQIVLMQEQNLQAKEQTKTIVLQNNKLIEDTKLVDAQTQQQLKQVELADIQKVEAKARIKMLAQQLDKEKEGMALIKAQVATAMAQLSLIQDQMKASRAQYSDTIDGKPVGGLLGAQIAVNKVQASSFERKAFLDLASNLQQGWGANKTSDIAISSPVSFTPLILDRVLNWGMTKYFNMPEDTIQTPEGYTPYMTDEQMDAEEPVSYKVQNKTGK